MLARIAAAVSSMPSVAVRVKVVRTGFEPVLSYILSGCQLNVFHSIITLPQLPPPDYKARYRFSSHSSRHEHSRIVVRVGFEPTTETIATAFLKLPDYLGKQKMGAWTSAFMIGFTLAFNLLIRLAYPKEFPINLIFYNPVLQWDCFTLLTNDSEEECASILRGIPEFSIPWPQGQFLRLTVFRLSGKESNLQTFRGSKTAKKVPPRRGSVFATTGRLPDPFHHLTICAPYRTRTDTP